MGKARPTIGLALSGASGRAIAHIGVLEVMTENNIPIDYIAACSSGTIVAASFACKTMDKLKETFLNMDKQSFLKLLAFDKEGSGVFNLEKAEDVMQEFTLGQKFEDIKPRLSFVACDIQTGEPVSLFLGDLAKAVRISCSIPFLFSPVRWGRRVLVDGGLFSLVPVDQAKELGADLVIGVDIAASRYTFKKRYIYIFRILRWIFSWFNRFYQNSIKTVFYTQSDFFKEELIEKSPNLFTVLEKAMNIASEQHKKGSIPTCDIMLSPNVKHFGRIDPDNAKEMYLEGRRVTLEALPEIKKLIRDYNWRNKADTLVKNRMGREIKV